MQNCKTHKKYKKKTLRRQLLDKKCKKSKKNKNCTCAPAISTSYLFNLGPGLSLMGLARVIYDLSSPHLYIYQTVNYFYKNQILKYEGLKCPYRDDL